MSVMVGVRPAPEIQTNITVTESEVIRDLFVIRLPIYYDERGFFKENFHVGELASHGLLDCVKLQKDNCSFTEAGLARGIHPEPFPKYLSVGHGKVFSAFVDLRRGGNFGQVLTMEMDPSIAVFVPVGIGNSFLALEPTLYNYKVGSLAEWKPGKYPAVNLLDPELAIKWPIPIDWAKLSQRDREGLRLRDFKPF